MITGKLYVGSLDRRPWTVAGTDLTNVRMRSAMELLNQLKPPEHAGEPALTSAQINRRCNASSVRFCFTAGYLSGTTLLH
jgi:hypothetical protein